jgi:hypothetical protein
MLVFFAGCFGSRWQLSLSKLRFSSIILCFGVLVQPNKRHDASFSVLCNLDYPSKLPWRSMLVLASILSESFTDKYMAVLLCRIT